MTARVAIGLVLSAVVIAAVAWYTLLQRPGTPVIGILHPSPVHAPAVSGFMEQMQAYGYEDGISVIYLYDGPAGGRSDLSNRAQELVSNGATLIYAASTPATRAVLDAVEDADIDVVFGPVNDPVGANFVDSLRQPGEGITGVTLAPSTGKRLAWFKQFSPAATRILVPYNPDDPSSTSSLDRLESSATSLGLTLEIHSVRNLEETRALFNALPSDIDGIFLPRDSMINAAIDEIVESSIAQNLPLSGPGFNQVTRGALFGYGVQQEDVGRTAARLANEILSGTDPADIPVEIVDSNLYINTDTARALGLTLSPALLAQARAILP